MKAIMYHYVREHSNELPNFVYLDVESFKEQVDYFSRSYNLISKSDFENSIYLREPIKNSVVLTFDDGLLDHYEYVYPVLKERGLWGVFYIPSKPYEDDSLLNVHKIHYLLGKFDSQTVFEVLLSLVTTSDYVENAGSRFKNKLYSKQRSGEYTKAVKEIVNYYLKPSLKDELIKKLFESFVKNEKEIFNKYYISKAQIRTMADGGMIMASHSHSHTLLSNLTSQEQSSEIVNSLSFIKDCSGRASLDTFCYPYGGIKSYDQNTLKLLKSNGVKYAFSVESRDITRDDLIDRPLELPRYDCNEFPYGKAANYNV